MLKVLAGQPSVIDHYLSELRDVELQKNRPRFEQNLERLGQIAGYEVSRMLGYDKGETTTPLGQAEAYRVKDQLVINTVLRAGLPVQRGLKSVLDMAELSFIAAGRKPDTSAGVEIDLAYVATPEIKDKTLIIADTMLATGKSIVDAYEALISGYGQPSRVIVVAIIGSQTGVDYVQQQIKDVDIVICAVDPELNSDYYIVPGLGDAGDLLYGPKAGQH
jgi:uracil phosphoribosyltransferase